MPLFCFDDKHYNLKADKKGYAFIPAEKRITVSASYAMSTGIETYLCGVSASFIPKTGETYMAYSELLGNCYIDIFRVDPKRAHGLAIEYSIADGQGCG